MMRWRPILVAVAVAMVAITVAWVVEGQRLISAAEVVAIHISTLACVWTLVAFLPRRWLRLGLILAALLSVLGLIAMVLTLNAIS